MKYRRRAAVQWFGGFTFAPVMSARWINAAPFSVSAGQAGKKGQLRRGRQEEERQGNESVAEEEKIGGGALAPFSETAAVEGIEEITPCRVIDEKGEDEVETPHEPGGVTGSDAGQGDEADGDFQMRIPSGDENELVYGYETFIKQRGQEISHPGGQQFGDTGPHQEEGGQIVVGNDQNAETFFHISGGRQDGRFLLLLLRGRFA